MIAVVLAGADPYGTAAHLLDRGFASPATAQAGLERLPPVVTGDARDPVTRTAPAPRPVATPTTGRRGSSVHAVTAAVGAALLVLVGIAIPVTFLREVGRDRPC